ncbi:2-alkenal reductase (NADP(+)-dependent) [Lactuca sativa]|uniref:Enoyl reductase (ER) domain-containing protein n=1 Tax=Lactuca sativa TaxID=4236 RepID=A0A9R1V1G0_LACSA|nr:2-alkenal reductase (NADP(+)-dependent) [Lactuca sativa]KAJ0196481.1 hypothetical protein LSAT_V11C700359840 [Lactuca sativa]
MEVINRYVAIKAQIDGVPKESDFELKNQQFSLSIKRGSKEIIIKNLYVSIDPYHVNQMKTTGTLGRTIVPGEVISSYGVGKVIASGNPRFAEGDYVVGNISWGEYSISKGFFLRKLDPMGLPLSYHIGVLGLSGLSAYVGFFDICKPKRGENVFVSAASGSIGNLVGQYAKLLGCYVVGCAGSPEKVELLKEKLGFDEAFNYKEETDLNLALQRYFPNGIDIYFDNVGAEMLEAAISNMNLYGRVAVCGAISEYTDSKKHVKLDMLSIIYRRITIQGFITPDYMNLFPEFVSKTVDYIRAGKIHVLEDVLIGIESVPSAFVGVFHGNNVGKRIVKIADD